MPGLKSAHRAKLFRAVHAEALKRKLDHDGLRDMCLERFQVTSMGDLEDHQLLAIYKQWTGKTLKSTGKLPRRGEAAKLELASPGDLELVDAEASKRGMDEATKSAFVRRQLRGRTEIRTRRDVVQVLGGLRAMNRRGR